jgi:tetratricopeptide (TPR) repeat protein
MAFGFGFNKQKVLGAAEKYVQQGKLQNAIAEYEKILKNDPKDLTVLNTVGDLYARIGENDKATQCFKNVGDAYAAQGFTVKGIAMYKKISKLKPSLESVLKLAELYTQQGLFNDARAQYLQVAEEFLRAGELEQSVRIFQKILEMDPENVAMRVRLAEVYIRLGKKEDAWQIFSAAAETLRNRGSLNGAEEILQRMLTLDPGNSHALMLRARNALDSGDAATAIQFFEKVSNLDSNADALRELFKAYLQSGRINDAGVIAGKLVSAHNDVAALFSYVDALMQSSLHEETLQLLSQNFDRLLAANGGKVQELLHTLIGHFAGNVPALEKVLDLLQKAGDTSHLNEITELLAHASVQSGDLAKARELYQQLAQAEPQNPMHMQNYQQVAGMMAGGTGSRLITAEEGIVLIEELETTTTPLDQQYSPEVASALRAALTDAELFVSYNMPEKALGPLMVALPIAPQDVRLNQRLAALHTRAERFADAAACCRNLEQAYNDGGLTEDAGRYAELAQRCEERAAAGPVPHPTTSSVKTAAPWPVASAAVESHAEDEVAAFAIEPEELAVETAPEVEMVPETPGPSEFAVSEEVPADEIDLSAEWDGDVALEPAEAYAPAESAGVVDEVETAPEEVPVDSGDAVAETIEEIRFYIDHSMFDQARAAYAKLETLTDDAEKLVTVLSEIEAAVAPGEETAEFTEQAEPEAPVSTDEPHSPALNEFVADLDASLGEGFRPGSAPHAPAPKESEFELEHEIVAHAATNPELVGHLDFMSTVPTPQAHAEPEAEAAEAQPVPEPVAEVAEPEHGGLGDFVADLEASLGDGFLPEAPAQPEKHEAVHASAKPQHAEPAFQASAPVVPQPAYIPPPAAVPASPAAAAAAAAPALQPTAAPSTFRTAVRPVPQAGAPHPADKGQVAASVDLADMFGELKHELEEDVATAEEDPETHYNLGVAFREMGLLDEAIGELQKVCQAVDRGHPFPHIMQTYTWLAQCFLDKGVPEAAIRWYEKALKLPGLDQDTRTALHYELAASYETAHDRNAALQHFMEVYGSNIDYRDVGERIKALKS